METERIGLGLAPKRKSIEGELLKTAFIQVVNLFIVYELDTWPRDLNIKFTIGESLFGVVKLTKDTISDKYWYNGYGIGFGARLNFSSNGELGKNVINFGVGNSLSAHTDNRR